MESHCSNCGAQLDVEWVFCPHCGGAITGRIAKRSESEPPEPAPAEGAFGGLLFGLLAVPILGIVGVMLCLTGPGAILGIPMIIAAVLAPLAGPLFGMAAHKGKCPCCGTAVTAVTDSRNHVCPVCNAEFAIRRGEISKAA